MTPHTFLRGQCQACGVLETLLLGLRGTPLDTEPRPHHTDPHHNAYAPHCPLCKQLQSYVCQLEANLMGERGGMAL